MSINPYTIDTSGEDMSPASTYDKNVSIESQYIDTWPIASGHTNIENVSVFLRTENAIAQDLPRPLLPNISPKAFQALSIKRSIQKQVESYLDVVKTDLSI